jgi:hypothetical protein
MLGEIVDKRSDTERLHDLTAELRRWVIRVEERDKEIERLRAAVSQFLEDFRAGTHDEWQASLTKLREALRREADQVSPGLRGAGEK